MPKFCPFVRYIKELAHLLQCKIWEASVQCQEDRAVGAGLPLAEMFGEAGMAEAVTASCHKGVGQKAPAYRTLQVCLCQTYSAAVCCVRAAAMVACPARAAPGAIHRPSQGQTIGKRVQEPQSSSVSGQGRDLMHCYPFDVGYKLRTGLPPMACRNSSAWL